VVGHSPDTKRYSCPPLRGVPGPITELFRPSKRAVPVPAFPPFQNQSEVRAPHRTGARELLAGGQKTWGKKGLNPVEPLIN
jgi:hypothetical protein